MLRCSFNLTKEATVRQADVQELKLAKLLFKSGPNWSQNKQTRLQIWLDRLMVTVHLL